MNVKSVSPSRQYVAICVNARITAHYFRMFTLPEGEENDSERATLYYLDRLDAEAYVQNCVTLEDFLDLSPQAGALVERARERAPAEYQADSDAHYDVAFDLHSLASGYGNPHVAVRVTFHIGLNLKRYNPHQDAGYTSRYETKYRERYQYWLNIRESLKS